MKIFLIAGEASGDLHGSNLAKELLRAEPAAQLRGWGGDLMAKSGVEITKHYSELAFMGFVEVLMNIRTIMRNFKICKEDIARWKPDVLVLIDYPGFNLRMAEWAKAQGIRVFYYISPQIWAWKENRVHSIRKNVDQMCVVLPFEKEFYAKHNYPVEFVGHPLLDAIQSGAFDEKAFRAEQGLDDRPVIALLPGSRQQEIRSMLPVMIEAAASLGDYQCVIAAAPSQKDAFYDEVAGEQMNRVKMVRGKTHDLLRIARAGLVTSGTATLEAGLIGMPQVVCYKGSPLSYLIARRLVKVKYISLVNLILDKPAVKELIQQDFNITQARTELQALLSDGPRRSEILADYESLRSALGGGGASERTASLLLKKA
ncbi:MAG: lipid-A-disaccharide synthase [Flavobacteriales bacterium]|jgi:lipid-A-disaccharide synthase